MRNLAIAAMAAASLWHGAAMAQTAPTLPDPATITVPDLSHSGDPEVVANGWKYFFFQREGVSFAEAHADLSDCYRFLQSNGWESVQLNRFVPWSGKTGRKHVYSNDYGLTGVLIMSLIEGTLARRQRQARMLRCMGTRGYVRYSVPEEIWENVIALPPAESIAVQAKIASGPNFGGKVPTK
ncbi:hypothetical protein ACCC88_05430 [Sphingomonas sp. Sphisp140]|uniref:hypothetical protein n=1 Tax=unclassified Sphingomonas TaxID=196159 RepID=UPI0039AFFF35